MTTLIALAFLVGGDATSFTCPVQGDAANNGQVVYYAGFKTKMCCGGCDSKFAKEPVKYLTATAAKKDAVAAEFMFDPVSHAAPKATASPEFSVYKGVRYLFDSSANKATFEKNPAKYAVGFPAKEALVCPVTMEEIADSHSAAGFIDVKGTRLYVCCGGCLGKLLKDPTAMAAKVAKKVTVAKTTK